jgi:alanine racemase
LINLDAIKENYDALQDRVGAAKIGASVKADAYGLGAPTVSKALYGAGCRTFFVATAGEGKILREAIGENASIYVLNGPAPQDLTLFFKFRLKPVINSIAQARLWTDEADRAKHAPFTALHIDTGMNRLGMDESDVTALSKNMGLFRALGPDLIMSHLACAPDKAHPLNAKQLEKFRKFAARFPVLPLSLANTAGIYMGRPYHFQMVRPGIGLYGGQATTEAKQEIFRPVVSLMAPVLQVKTVKAGESIGYNAKRHAARQASLACKNSACPLSAA